MLRDTDIKAIMSLVDFKISTSELGALFRNEDHPKFVACGDQILRNFLNGLIIYTRGTKERPKTPAEALKTKPVMATAATLYKTNTPPLAPYTTSTPKSKALLKQGAKKIFKKSPLDVNQTAYKNKKK